MKDEILMITYFFDENDGVGALRSITLKSFLEKKNMEVEVIDKNTFGQFVQKKMLLWSFFVFMKVLFSGKKKVYISCGPYQHLLFVSLASFLRRKQLIIDFRDPWSLNIKSGYNNTVNVNKFKLTIAVNIEKLSYKMSSYFIVCTKGMYNEYSKLFNDKKKMRIVTNGYDFKISKASKINSENNKRLDVVCLGKFAEYDEDKARNTLIRALKIKKNNQKITFHFIGSNQPENYRVLNELNLIDNVKFYPKTNYSSALKIAKKCNLAMLILRDEDIEYGSKVFDYIGLNIPIIDSFSNNSVFKKEFSQFLENYEGKNNLYLERKKYQRENIYNENKDIFME